MLQKISLKGNNSLWLFLQDSLLGSNQPIILKLVLKQTRRKKKKSPHDFLFLLQP